MKNLHAFLPVLLVVAATLCGCHNTRSVTDSDSHYADYSTLSSLAEVLRRHGGVEVKGVGSQVRVQIRGANSFNLNTEPLYVINEIPMGHKYADANNAINVKDIVDLRVLRSYSETNSYGEMGRNGVIKIRTKIAD